MPKITEPTLPGSYAIIEPDSSREKLLGVPDEPIQDLMKTYGAVLFRGFKLTKRNFKQIGERLCSGFVSNESGGRSTVGFDKAVQTAPEGPSFLPLHPEMERVPWRPDLCFFGCLKADNAASGGETLLCDGVLALQKMKPETREFLTARSLRYRVRTNKEHCEKWIGVSDPDEDDMERARRDDFFVFTLEDGRYYRNYYVPALRKPILSDELAMVNFIIYARFFNNTREFPSLEDGTEIPEELCHELKTLCDGLAIAHGWETNDLLVFDNTRYQHGRHPVLNPRRRKIITQFGYASFAPFTEAELAERPWRTSPNWGPKDF